MLDADLAKIYQVETKVLNQAVKRNIDRFPPEFMFQLIPPLFCSCWFVWFVVNFFPVRGHVRRYTGIL